MANGRIYQQRTVLSKLNICRITWIWNAGTEEVVGICADELHAELFYTFVV